MDEIGRGTGAWLIWRPDLMTCVWVLGGLTDAATRLGGSLALSSTHHRHSFSNHAMAEYDTIAVCAFSVAITFSFF